MNIRLLSDIHLEFGAFHPGEGDVLVLAGDICCARDYADENVMSDRYNEFFENCVLGYNKIFYTLGNHESYRYDFTKTTETLRRCIPSGITLLDNQSEYYEGIHFIGLPLWTNFNNKNKEDMEYASSLMNDYNLISKGARRLQPEDTYNEHVDSMNWLEKCLASCIGNTMVISHHAPSFKSVSNQYRGENANPAYASNLESFIMKHPQIKMWAHGHIHESSRYMIGECMVVSNPRGYHAYEENIGFDNEMNLVL